MLSRSLTAALLACCATTACRRAQPEAVPAGAAGDLAIVGATVLPMDREGTLADHTVLVRGATILAVAPASAVEVGAATVVDGRGKYLVPGLADMHVHLIDEAWLPLFLLSGVTTVRDLFGSPRQLDWRERIRRGELAGPTLFTAGPILDGDPPTWPGSAVVTSPEAARREVRAQKQAGYDWIKVYNQLGAEVYRAVLDEAKAQGLPVAGHVPRAVGVAGVVASGQRSIEHLDGYVPFTGEPVMDAALVAATARATVWNCPTLVVTDRFGRMDDPASLEGTRGLDTMSPAVRSMWQPANDFRLSRFTPAMFAAVRERNQLRRQLVGRLAAARARLVLGTDSGNPYVVPGYAVHDELALLVAAGLTRWQAIHAATAAAAELAGTPRAFGVIAAGARADLLLVDRDPLADVGALADPPLVVVRGQVRRRADMLAAAKAGRPSLEERLAAMPPLEMEGERPVTAGYQVLLNGAPIGAERAVLAGGGKHRVVRGQIAFDSESWSYRATPGALLLEKAGERIEVSRAGSKVVATRRGGAPVELAAAAGAIIAPQAIAEFVFYADLLAGLKVGASRTIEAAEVVTDRGLVLEPGRFSFTRQPDAGGRRVYRLSGQHGKLDLEGTLAVDPDGAPHEVSIRLRFGTFVLRRTGGGRPAP